MVSTKHLKSILLFLTVNLSLFGQADSSKNLPEILGINHIGVNVKNLNESILFYKNVFGLEVSQTNSFKKPLKKQAKFNRKETILEGPNANIHLTEFDQKGTEKSLPFQGPGITHICYQVPSTKPIYAKMKKSGANIVSRGDKPVDLGGYGIYYTYALDPNEILFENEQMDKPHFQEDTWIGHIAIATKDIDKMVDFYSLFLDKKPHRRSTINNDNPKLDDIGNVDHIRLKGAWFRTENMVFEFWEYQNPKPIEITKDLPFNAIGYQYIAFEVVNIQKEYNRLKKLGMNILHKPISIADKKEFKLRDPEGNLLVVQEIKGANSLINKKKLTEK